MSVGECPAGIGAGGSGRLVPLANSAGPIIYKEGNNSELAYTELHGARHDRGRARKVRIHNNIANSKSADRGMKGKDHGNSKSEKKNLEQKGNMRNSEARSKSTGPNSVL
jgi:hypothetical protein